MPCAHKFRYPLLMIIGLFCLSALILIFFLYRFTVIPGHSGRGLNQPGNDLDGLQNQLQRHVKVLSEDIGERHHEIPESLDRTVAYITQELRIAGYDPEIQSFGDRPYYNVIAEITGGKKKNEIIIVGAHYDTVWLSPGADDNASGVAALLEIAGNFSDSHPARTIRFVAFGNEEEPFSGTVNMGSLVYARSVLEKRENIIGMFSLEMLGYYSEEAGSQSYPVPLSWFYPDTALFVAFVANISSRPLLVRTIRHFRQNSDFPAEGLAAPESLVPHIRRSDHASFWDAGYPAVMVTDTANFRNMNYHTVGDVARTLDYEKMVRVVNGLMLMLEDLAQDDS